MKKLSMIALVPLIALALGSCGGNSSNKDAVETADSINTNADTSTSRMGDSTGIAEADSKFATEAANAGMAEIALSDLALKKATNADVKAFAQQMITDHKAAAEKLKALATAKNITLPAVTGEEEQKTAADLQTKAGAEFDKAYVDIMVKDHDKAVSLFEDGSKNCVDADLKAYATETLPTLKAHQEHIKTIKDKMK